MCSATDRFGNPRHIHLAYRQVTYKVRRYLAFFSETSLLICEQIFCTTIPSSAGGTMWNRLNMLAMAAVASRENCHESRTFRMSKSQIILFEFPCPTTNYHRLKFSGRCRNVLPVHGPRRSCHVLQQKRPASVRETHNSPATLRPVQMTNKTPRSQLYSEKFHCYSAPVFPLT